MKVLVDTCIWSEALRHKKNKIPSRNTSELIELIKEARVEIIGAIRQEILSGIKSKQQFEKLREQLKEFYDVEVTTIDYEKKREFALENHQGNSLILLTQIVKGHNLQATRLFLDVCNSCPYHELCLLPTGNVHKALCDDTIEHYRWDLLLVLQCLC